MQRLFANSPYKFRCGHEGFARVRCGDLPRCILIITPSANDTHVVEEEKEFVAIIWELFFCEHFIRDMFSVRSSHRWETVSMR